MGLISVIMILVLISFFLKDHYKVSRSKEMRISAEKVYALVADFNQWKEWSPWYPMDTTTQYVFSGTPEKAGYSKSSRGQTLPD